MYVYTYTYSHTHSPTLFISHHTLKPLNDNPLPYELLCCCVLTDSANCQTKNTLTTSTLETAWKPSTARY